MGTSTSTQALIAPVAAPKSTRIIHGLPKCIHEYARSIGVAISSLRRFIILVTSDMISRIADAPDTRRVNVNVHGAPTAIEMIVLPGLTGVRRKDSMVYKLATVSLYAQGARYVTSESLTGLANFVERGDIISVLKWKPKSAKIDAKGVIRFTNRRQELKHVFTNLITSDLRNRLCVADQSQKDMYKKMIQKLKSLSKYIGVSANITELQSVVSGDIGSAYIEGIIKSNIQELYKNGKPYNNFMVIVHQPQDKHFRIATMLSAERSKRAPSVLHGELICSKPVDDIKGLGKLTMGAMLLMAKRMGIKYVFIEAATGSGISGGVQSALYARFGFHGFSWSTASQEAMDVLEYADFHDELLHHGNIRPYHMVNMVLSMFKKASAKTKEQMKNVLTEMFAFFPMWIQIDSNTVQEACITRIMQTKGWSCSKGGPGQPATKRYGYIETLKSIASTRPDTLRGKQKQKRMKELATYEHIEELSGQHVLPVNDNTRRSAPKRKLQLKRLSPSYTRPKRSRSKFKEGTHVRYPLT